LLGNSPAIQRARAQIELAAASNAAVIITGPAGAGKDHVARAIHYQRKAPGTLVPLSCAVLETNLLRSTLRAAWSKSHNLHETSSTLMLDDIDAMPPEAQSDLVELMASEPSRVRVISTSACGLAEVVSRGQFSPRLACLLSTIAIELPPLAQRLEDLPVLAQAMLEEHNARGGKQVGGFSPEALDQLAAYSWPGNLDELSAIVRQAHERSSGGQVTERDLPDAIRWAAHAATHPPRPDEAIDLETFLARVEKELLARALRRARGNKSKAAKLLGLTRPRLYRRLVALGLEQPDDKQEP
jgi:DNA-binding NtrC family response regulator